MAKKKTVYAGFWLRLSAFVIDVFILMAISLLINLIIGRLLPEMNNAPISIKRLIFSNGIMLFASWLYNAGLESSSKQATIGKLALGLKVTDLKNKRISLLRATGRFLGQYLSSFLLGVGHIMIGFTEKKQGLHDILAGCLVVKK